MSRADDTNKMAQNMVKSFDVRRDLDAARNAAVTKAKKAVANFEKSSGKKVDSSHHVVSNYPTNDPCLQVVDYVLWALQRLYEKQEDRYFNYLSEKFVRIIDLDDKRKKDYGVYYDKRNPLTVEKIKDS